MHYKIAVQNMRVRLCTNHGNEVNNMCMMITFTLDPQSSRPTLGSMVQPVL